jgi:hypothetical protein
MYTLSLTGWADRLASSQRHGRRSSFARLSVEALEDRYAPAVVSPVVVAPAATPTVQSVGSAALLALPSLFVPPSAVAAAATTPGPGVRVSFNPLLSPAIPTSMPLAGQGLNAIPSFTIPTGFPGRVEFPNTGVTSRGPLGDGPMTQTLSLYLVGGGGDQTQTPEPAPPPRRVPPPIVPLPGLISIDVPLPVVDIDGIGDVDVGTLIE